VSVFECCVMKHWEEDQPTNMLRGNQVDVEGGDVIEIETETRPRRDVCVKRTLR
jgi:hypothetical protein